MLISVGRIGKNQLESGQESVGDAPVLSNYSSRRNPWRKLTGVLEHFREGETDCLFSIFGAFPSDRIPEVTKDFDVCFFIRCFPNAATPVNYTSEFREIFEVSISNLHLKEFFFPQAELKRLYTQLEVLKNKTIRADNPHISKRRGGRKVAHRRFSLQVTGGSSPHIIIIASHRNAIHIESE